MNLARRGDGEETDAKARYYRAFDETRFGSPSA
jgi:hypothetical protein